MKKINEEFVCLHCGHKNIEAKKTCRNHCTKCLYSLHMDDKEPGDRLSKCHGLMEPYGIDQDRKIIHKCTKCGTMQKNKPADDDNMDKIIEISTYGATRANKRK